MTERSASGSVGAAAPGEGSYAGDVDVDEAWRMLKDDPSAVLVDVRTNAEWNYVGVPDLSELSKDVKLIEWQGFPATGVNPAFVPECTAAIPDTEAPVLFLCRSGARSRSAAIAMTEAGYAHCFNVSGGFEGPHDSDRHRGSVDGWKARGLPWVQG